MQELMQKEMNINALNGHSQMLTIPREFDSSLCQADPYLVSNQAEFS